MISLIFLAGIPSLALAIWQMTELVRSRRSRLWLAVAIPCLLSWPIGIYWYSSSFLGYPTTEKIDREFTLISSFADDSRQSVFALVRLQGDPLPRLYEITGSYQQNKKGFGMAQANASKGVQMAGRPKRSGIEDAGDFVLYQLPPQGVPAKD